MNKVKSFVKNSMKKKSEGAISFEYIIILVVMVAFITAVFVFLTNKLNDKANNIGESIDSFEATGKGSGMSTGGH